jgi:uncharacterized iron-regulated membrane protein
MTAASASLAPGSQARGAATPRSGLYYRLWRWHFWAGLACVPLIVLLSITGSIYLFKTEIEGWLENPLRELVYAGPPAAPERIVAGAQSAPIICLRSRMTRSS